MEVDINQHSYLSVGESGFSISFFLLRQKADFKAEDFYARERFINHNPSSTVEKMPVCLRQYCGYEVRRRYGRKIFPEQLKRMIHLSLGVELSENEHSVKSILGNQVALEIHLDYQSRVRSRVDFTALENNGLFALVLGSFKLLPNE